MDPWSSDNIDDDDIDRIIKEFGIEVVSESVRQKFIGNRFFPPQDYFWTSFLGRHN